MARCTDCTGGCLGCQCKKETSHEETKSNTACDYVWGCILGFSTWFAVTWLVVWLIFENNFLQLDGMVYELVGKWIQCYIIVLAVIAVILFYLVILYILALCRTGDNMRVYIHPCNRFLVVLGTVVLLAILGVVTWKWENRFWSLFVLSIQIIGPFLQLGCVIVLTLISWCFAGYWFKVTHSFGRAFMLLFSSLLLVFVYMSPLLMKSACITEKLPPKPSLTALRGDSSVAPENSMAAFESAVKHNASCLETDVRLSRDGVAFLMKDDTLERTTNVKAVFPGREKEHCTNFNSAELMQLNIGENYIRHDPYLTVSKLSGKQVNNYKKQKIVLLTDFLLFAKSKKVNVMLNQKSIMKGHYFENERNMIAVKTIISSGIPQKQVWWLSTDKNSTNKDGATGVTDVATGSRNLFYMRSNNYEILNAGYHQLSTDKIRNLTDSDIHVNMWEVNSKWLFSLYWCTGTGSVSTGFVSDFSKMTSPVWTLTPLSYCIVWMIVDVFSFVTIVLIFVIQYYRSRLTILSISLNRDQESVGMQEIQSQEGTDHIRYKPEENVGYDNEVLDEKL